MVGVTTLTSEPSIESTHAEAERGTEAERIIKAADYWPTNADLIADLVFLGYLHSDDHVLDPTYGDGKWWTMWRPGRLTLHDKFKLDGVDFTDLPEPADVFDVAAYDPPYVATGGRETSTLEMSEQGGPYGMFEAPKTPALLQLLINQGLREMVRVVRGKVRGEGRRGGIVLVKCQDYVSSGKLWPGTFHTQRAAEGMGLVLLDRFEHLSEKGRAQPKGRTKKVKVDGTETRVPSAQEHAKRNLSTLLVFENRKDRMKQQGGKG